MKIKKIQLNNYRKFQHLEVSFDEGMTVITALNGSGKTAVLDAIRASLWSFVRKIDAASGSSGSKPVGICIDDVTLLDIDSNMEYQVPTIIKTQLIDGMSWEISRTKITPRTNTIYLKARSIEKFSQELQAKTRDTNDSREVRLPIIAFYGTGRLWNQKQLTKTRTKLDDHFFSRTHGYLDCLDSASSYKYFLQWFRWLYESHREQQIRSIEDGKNILETKYQPYIKAIQEVVREVVQSETNWGRIEYSVSKNDIVLYHKKHGELKLSQLSYGIRSVVSLVADIAYRCIKLNGSLGEIVLKESEGIVLIDEVDMHLHPDWQQKILKQLQNAFPKIQFIVTTHSPQVLSTIHAKNIRILGDNQDGKSVAGPPLAPTYGEPSYTVLQAVMQVDPQPPVDEKNDLEDLIKFVEQGDYKKEKVKKLLNKLKKSLNFNHPQILKIERSIRRMEALGK